MESIDRQILSLLAADGRISYTDIGRETGLSTSAAQQRVRRLEQRGLVTGYTALFDNDKLGHQLTAIVALSPVDVSKPDTVAEDLHGVPEVVSCYSVAGDANYLIKIQVPSAPDLERVLNLIHTQAGCATHTTLVLTTHFENRVLLPPADVDD